MSVLKGMADAFHMGGPGMWPILILLMLTIAIVVERAVFLRRAVVDKEKLMGLLRSLRPAIVGWAKPRSGVPTLSRRARTRGPGHSARRRA